ncbi:hypothetical protein GIB67_038222 [Kingdonia uniflora]|uniref:Uncharacterized protein n=1 Tax=Kingdonia uniflora TaxID=39325 RepID=A0A7J7NH28_9MAGN|nr:hypothetical protein GIB67_038222 [Kingdonia uniflora]
MLTSGSIGRYPTQVPYDDTWSVLFNARQLLPNIDSGHIKSGNVSILYLRTYFTIATDREDDITIARVFILFMMGHLRFQTATTLSRLDISRLWPIWMRLPNMTGVQLFLLPSTMMTYGERRSCPVQGCYFKSQMEIASITWWIDVGGSLLALQRMGNIDLFGPSTHRAGITPMVVTSMSIHSLSQDFSLPESARDAQRIHELTDDVSTLRRHLDSIDDQLYAHSLHLRRGRDVRVVPLPPEVGTRMRHRGSGPRTRGSGRGCSGPSK